MNKIGAAYDDVCLRLSSFTLCHPKGHMAITAIMGAVSIVLFLASDLLAQALDQQVGQALNPLARLLIGPVAKGLAIIGLFSFVGFLYAGKWLIAVSSLVASIILGLLGQIVSAIFQGGSPTTFSLTG